MGLKEVTPTTGGSLVGPKVERIHHLADSHVEFPERVEGAIAQRCIDLHIGDLDASLDHCLVAGFVGACGRKGSAVVFAELIAYIGEYGFIPVGPHESHLQVGAQDGPRQSAEIGTHPVDRTHEVGCLLGSRSLKGMTASNTWQPISCPVSGFT